MLHWILCRLGFGGLRIIEDRGAWQYSECLTCGRRWAENLTGRVGPRDDVWIETGEWSEPRPQSFPPMPPRKDDGNGTDETDYGKQS